MYELTLTGGERMAIDCIGDRYASGNDLRDVIEDAMPFPPEAEWHHSVDITWHLSESQAWAIQSIAEEMNYTWPCFDAELVRKLNLFCEGIV